MILLLYILLLITPERLVSTRGYDYSSGKSFRCITEIYISDSNVLIKSADKINQYHVIKTLPYRGHRVYELYGGKILDYYPGYIILRHNPKDKYHKDIVAYYGFLN